MPPPSLALVCSLGTSLGRQLMTVNKCFLHLPLHLCRSRTLEEPLLTHICAVVGGIKVNNNKYASVLIMYNCGEGFQLDSLSGLICPHQYHWINVLQQGFF